MRMENSYLQDAISNLIDENVYYSLGSSNVNRLIIYYIRSLLNLFRKPSDYNLIVDFFKILNKYRDWLNAEKELKLWLKKFWDKKIWQSLSLNRANLYASQIGPMVQQSNLLDIGSGNGLIGSMLETKFNCSVVYCDTINYLRINTNKFIAIDDRHLPFRNNSFENVIMVTVLHHTRHWKTLLNEAARIASKRIVIKESVIGVPQKKNSIEESELNKLFLGLSTNEQLEYTRFFDWFYNRVLETGVEVPFLFQTPNYWIQIFRELGRVQNIIDLGIDDSLGALYHIIYTIDL